MATSNSLLIFKKIFVPSKERFVPLKEGLESSVDKETEESLKANITQPNPFFRGAVLALILSLPFWGVLFWLIFT